MLTTPGSDLILAPIAGYSDAGMRSLCFAYGAGLCFTEMVSAKGLFYGNENTAALLHTDPSEINTGVQLFGKDPEIFAEVVRYPALKKFPVIDVNMGCPVRKITSNGEGSALMRSPELIEKIVRAVKQNSGKTTTVRALLRFYQPTSGELLIDGQPYDPESSLNVGYLPEERGLYKKETVLDNLLYFAKLKHVKNPEDWCTKYLKRVGLEDKAREKLEKLSGGQQQKIQLGVTLMGDPKLLVLDEPTKGFDPMNRRLLLEIINELHDKGCAIILITHYMDEVEKLCDRALLLKDGKAMVYGTIPEIRKKYHNKSLEQIFIETYGDQNE